MGTEALQFGTPAAIERPRWTLAAYRNMVRKHLGHRAELELKSLAHKTWDIAPAEQGGVTPPAIYLPGQMERVTGWQEGLFFPYVYPGPTMQGGLPVEHGPTRAFLLKDVWLIEGALYKGNASQWLSLRHATFPPLRVEHEIERAAVYCSHNGNRWFGTWMMEDCPTYALACNEGTPVTTAPSARHPLFGQAPAYEAWLGMQPLRLRTAFFRELVLFDDMSNNRNRYQRYRDMGNKLLAHVAHAPHPGVFILRGSDGERRMLRNELALAEHLRVSRGFRVIDPMRMSVSEIVTACAGARVVMGVEGSQLVHGVNVLQPGGTVFALQPPNRFVSYYKFLTDRDGQQFAFVVGTPDGEGYTIDIDEVERTLDLLPA
ncbi:glycosyltransferase family 61 protein [Pantoea sp. Tr-811]|uniref:glycosyltransferase 61 family protein n=1 Tax=Pantoea sp. Tr-811 TaxID=2608361 RepID=UPI00141E6245|nr:glycosyltransferase family 61 protein [Pantoea sp. Tr-811]NIF25214.1 glycosyltransferase family 61 protein [Pantoea sp. Tr-811]